MCEEWRGERGVVDRIEKTEEEVSVIIIIFFNFFFFNDTATTEIYTLSLHDALPISSLVQMEERALLL